MGLDEGAKEMNDEYLGIIAICGDEGTGKSTMALSYPKPLFHMDLDVGGFRRAAWRLEGLRIKVLNADEELESIDWAEYDIVSKPYPKPIQMGKLLGQKIDVSTRNLIIPKKVEGMKELWQKIIIDFVKVCQTPEVRGINPDSATMLHNICHNSHLEELQERQLARWKKDHPQTPFNENDYREKLQPVEYGPAFDRMRAVFHTARSYGKNLILTHYPTDEYGPMPDKDGNMKESKTGIKILDGFKETVRLSDLVVWTRINESTKNGVTTRLPYAKITKCGIAGMGLSVIGLEIPATYEGIINLRNMTSPSKEVSSA